MLQEYSIPKSPTLIQYNVSRIKDTFKYILSKESF